LKILRGLWGSDESLVSEKKPRGRGLVSPTWSFHSLGVGVVGVACLRPLGTHVVASSGRSTALLALSEGDAGVPAFSRDSPAVRFWGREGREVRRHLHDGAGLRPTLLWCPGTRVRSGWVVRPCNGGKSGACRLRGGEPPRRTSARRAGTGEKSERPKGQPVEVTRRHVAEGRSTSVVCRGGACPLDRLCRPYRVGSAPEARGHGAGRVLARRASVVVSHIVWYDQPRGPAVPTVGKGEIAWARRCRRPLAGTGLVGRVGASRGAPAVEDYMPRTLSGEGGRRAGESTGGSGRWGPNRRSLLRVEPAEATWRGSVSGSTHDALGREPG